MSEHLSAFGDVGQPPGRDPARPGRPPWRARWPARRAAHRGCPAGRRRAAIARPRARLPWPRSSTGGSRSSRSAIDAGTRAAAAPGVGGGPTFLDLAIVPTAALAPPDADDSVIDRVGQWSTWGADRHRLRDRLRELRIAPWADADRRRRHAADGRRPGGARSPGRVDARVARATAGRPGRRDRWRLGRRCAAGRRPCARRRPASTRRRPVRARPRPHPGAARLDPRCRRAAGDGRRPHRRPAGAARDRRHAGRDADRPERRLGGRSAVRAARASST